MNRTRISLKKLRQISGWESLPEEYREDDTFVLDYEFFDYITEDDYLFRYVQDETLEGYEDDDEIPIVYIGGECIPLTKDEYEEAKRKGIF